MTDWSNKFNVINIEYWLDKSIRESAAFYYGWFDKITVLINHFVCHIIAMVRQIWSLDDQWLFSYCKDLTTYWDTLCCDWEKWLSRIQYQLIIWQADKICAFSEIAVFITTWPLLSFGKPKSKGCLFSLSNCLFFSS